MQNSTPQALLQLYNKIVTGQSTQSIREAELQLLRFEQFPSFVPDNAAIIYESKISWNVRKFAAVYLTKFSKRLIKQRQPQKCEVVMQQFLAIMSNPNLQIEIKILFISSVEALLHPQSNRLLKIEYNKQYTKLINDTANQQDGQIDFILIVLCGQAIFIKDAYNEQIKEIIKSTVLTLIQLIMKLIKRATEQSLQSRDLFLKIIRVLKEYSILIKLYFKKLALLDIQSMKILYLVELQTLITSILQLNYKENVINSTIFISIPSDQLISKLLNMIKTNFITVLTNSVRLIFTFTKHANLIATNPLYLKMPGILTYFVKSTSSLLECAPYYRLPNKIMMLQTLDEVISLLINSMRANNFYLTFSEHKEEIIEKIILPCLSLTPKDIENFYEDSQQFVQSTIQVVTRDVKVAVIHNFSNEEPQEQIKQFQTLRTLAAEFLNTFCKFQDGTLSHVIEFALSVLSNKQNGQKSLMLLIICILSHQFKERKDLKLKVSTKIIQLIETCSIPVINGNRKQQDLEYAHLLLTLSKLFFAIMEFFPNMVNQTYKIGIGIIQSPSVNQVHKYFVFELFNNLARVEQAAKYGQDLMMIYNHVFKNMQQGTIHLMDSYFILIKYNVEQFKKNPSHLIEAIKIICFHIQREVQKPQHNILLLSKYWNVIRQVGQCQDFIPALIPQIQECVIPLLSCIDGVKNVDYQEDILMLLTSFIEKGKAVTQGQQKMFEIIPKLFYGQYYCRFGHSFHAIQLFIFYGSNVLINNFAAIKVIVDMCLTSISNLQYKKRPMAQNENCEGALILQSLILRCGQFFNAELWTSIIKCVVKRLQQTNIKFSFFSSNLYALLSLILFHSHKFFSNQENQILLTKIISQIRVFSKIQYSPKVIIAGLAELLLLSQCQFIARRFTQILDTVVTLLEINSNKKQNYFEEEEDEEKQYSNSIIMLKNSIKILDQFTYFRNQVEKLKMKNLSILQRSVIQLPKAKKDFFSHILRIERVANEPRQIYKIKR